MIELWGRRNAYNVQKVLWALDELGLEYRHHELGSVPGDLETPEFSALNPHCRIPVLQAEGAVIWESNSIVRYLVATHSQGVLWPSAPLARSDSDRWMDWELATLQGDFLNLFWGYYRTPKKERNAQQLEQSKARCAAHLNQLNNHLENRAYLAGADFTMADIACGTFLYRYFEMGLEVENPTNVIAWYTRLITRPAYQKNIMNPFSELKGRLQF